MDLLLLADPNEKIGAPCDFPGKRRRFSYPRNWDRERWNRPIRFIPKMWVSNYWDRFRFFYQKLSGTNLRERDPLPGHDPIESGSVKIASSLKNSFSEGAGPVY